MIWAQRREAGSAGRCPVPAQRATLSQERRGARLLQAASENAAPPRPSERGQPEPTLPHPRPGGCSHVPGFSTASKQVNTKRHPHTPQYKSRGGRGGVQTACTEPSWLSQRGFINSPEVVSSPVPSSVFKYNPKNSLHLIVNVRDVHAVEDVEFEVIPQHSSQDIEGDVGPAATGDRPFHPHSTRCGRGARLSTRTARTAGGGPAFPPAQHAQCGRGARLSTSTARAVRERGPPFQLQHHTHSPGEGPAFPPAAPHTQPWRGARLSTCITAHTALERGPPRPTAPAWAGPRAAGGEGSQAQEGERLLRVQRAASGLRGLPLLVCLDASFSP